MSLSLDPYTPHIGVRIDGLNLQPENIEQTVSYIRDLLDRYLVLVIKKQSLSPIQLRDIVSQFGPLFLHHSPEVLEMLREPEGERLFGGSAAGLFAHLAEQEALNDKDIEQIEQLLKELKQ